MGGPDSKRCQDVFNNKVETADLYNLFPDAQSKASACLDIPPA